MIFSILMFVIIVPLVVVVIAGMWKAFEKAGQPGWGCLVPFYNYYLFTVIAGRPGWWVVLLLLPYVNIIFLIIVFIDIAKKFGKGTGYGIGLALLGFIFWPMLGFGDAQYLGDSEASLESGVSSFGSAEKDINTESEEK